VNLDNSEFYKENELFDSKDKKGILTTKSKHSVKNNRISMIDADVSTSRNGNFLFIYYSLAG